jgi:hypothetical protein
MTVHRHHQVAVPSNWDEKDFRARIAYLRALLPVSITVPTDRVPVADDCEVYTLWTPEGHVAGCRQIGLDMNAVAKSGRAFNATAAG